jgi:subtilisin family serine protease
VHIFAARVCDKTGDCPSDGIIAAVNAVANHKSVRNRIINLSLGGDKEPAVDAAVDRASAAGVLVVVAAGNEDQDACNVSPGEQGLSYHMPPSKGRDSISIASAVAFATLQDLHWVPCTASPLE